MSACRPRLAACTPISPAQVLLPTPPLPVTNRNCKLVSASSVSRALVSDICCYKPRNMSFRSAHRSPYIERALTKAGHAPRVSSALLGLVLALSALGCRKPAPSATESKPAETATAAPTAAPAPSSTAPLYRPPPVLGHRDAVGPDLVILPGTGVGAIRFGTNLTKLQQLMEGPCDVLTETRCGYIRAASEFTLDAGVVT